MENGFTIRPQTLPVTQALRERSSVSRLPLRMREAQSESGAKGISSGLAKETLPSCDIKLPDLGMETLRRSNSNDTAGSVSIQAVEMEIDIWNREKRPKLELPPLPYITDIDLVASSTPSLSDTNYLQLAGGSPTRTLLHTKPRPSFSWPPSSPVGDVTFSNPFGRMPPLTPPHEPDAYKWSTPGLSTSLPRNQSLSSDQDNTRPEIAAQQNSSSTARPSTISLPGYVNVPDQNSAPSTWLDRAVNTIVLNHSGGPSHRGQVQMVVQALPSQTKNPLAKPAFQEVAENLQHRAAQVPYITITHAVSQVVSMEEVPASPPATPNNQHDTDDYFDNQTIFTHAAVVPNYHGNTQPRASMPTRPTGIIAAPASIQISTLERYIPPTTGEEVDDFFSISRRSYLVDRLTELSAENGTLLLVYPTQVGGAVFAHQYIGPVLDPFLRQFVLLNNLTTHVASALGRLAALPKMKTYEEMQTSLAALCRALTQRAPGRGLRGEFNIIHAEKVEVTLDRMSWMGWFIEQESTRFRQDIIEYQKAGGRMPTRGFDASPGSLARVVVDGLNASREEAGGAGIEVGVFVIRRSIL